MIIKSYEILKLDLSKYKIFLFHGENEGLKDDIIKNITKTEEILNYEQSEITEEQDILNDILYNETLFQSKKLIIIKRCNDKITNIIENISLNKIGDTKIILISDILEKKSKLRNKFEKDKNLICTAFYQDTDLTLSRLAYDFLKKKQISISPNLIDKLIRKIRGKRNNLYKELEKISLYASSGKKINEEKILKLVNLSENNSFSELIDNFLIKNKKKIINILNENIFSNDDCIQIARILLNKSKKILELTETFEKNNSIDITISTAKPAIFWKDKDIVKEQIYKWKPNNIKKLIYNLHSIELQIKKNSNNSLNIISDFILKQV